MSERAQRALVGGVGAFAAAFCLGCGSRPAAPCGADAAFAGGPDGAADGGADLALTPLRGVRSFDVTVTAPVMGTTGGEQVSFTLVLDVEGNAAYVGRQKIHMLSGGTFFDLDPFVLGAGPLVGGPTYFSSLTQLTWDGTVLSGTAQLEVRSGVPGQVVSAFQGMAVGVPDVTRPRLSSFPERAVRPFLPLMFVSSEPLPGTAAVRLAGVPVGKTFEHDFLPLFALDDSTGAGAETFPETPSGAVFAFAKPDVVLGYNMTYQLLVERVTDFAGLTLVGTIGGDFLTPPPPPLLAPDGFESAADAAVPGGVIVGAASFPILAGGHSLYIAKDEFPVHPCSTIEGSFATTQLSVPAGATHVRFSYRTVSTYGLVTGHPSVAIGSEGRSIARALLVPTLAPAKTVLPDGSMRYLGEPRTLELALPADVGPEVLVDFEDLVEGCGAPRSPNGLLVDDLRVE